MITINSSVVVVVVVVAGGLAMDTGYAFGCDCTTTKHHTWKQFESTTSISLVPEAIEKELTF